MNSVTLWYVFCCRSVDGLSIIVAIQIGFIQFRRFEICATISSRAIFGYFIWVGQLISPLRTHFSSTEQSILASQICPRLKRLAT